MNEIKQTKVCTKCGEKKSLSDFPKLKRSKDGHNQRCRDCHNTANREYSSKPGYKKRAKEYIALHKELRARIQYKYNHSDKRKECDIRYKEKHPERIKKNGKKHRETEHYKNHIEERKPIRRQKDKERRGNDISYRIGINLRSRIRTAVLTQNSPKFYSFNEYIGCTPMFLRKYIESRFREGMNWGNYGFKGWHLDHIVPCASFDLTNIEEQRECFHYTNLQPLWWWDNLRKSNKILVA